MSNFSDMDNVFIMDHPLIQHKIGIIRKKETGTKDFRQNIDVIEMIKSIQNMDSQTKKMISETIQVLFKCIQNEIKRGN